MSATTSQQQLTNPEGMRQATKSSGDAGAEDKKTVEDERV